MLLGIQGLVVPPDFPLEYVFIWFKMLSSDLNILILYNLRRFLLFRPAMILSISITDIVKFVHLFLTFAKICSIYLSSTTWSSSIKLWIVVAGSSILACILKQYSAKFVKNVPSKSIPSSSVSECI